MGTADEISSILAIGPDDLYLARRTASAPGAADPFILRSLLRQEQSLAHIADLLTEIRDRLPDPSTLISATAVLAPAIDPAPPPAPQPPAKRPRGS